jgi:hypothetical protein
MSKSKAVHIDVERVRAQIAMELGQPVLLSEAEWYLMRCGYVRRDGTWAVADEVGPVASAEMRRVPGPRAIAG